MADKKRIAKNTLALYVRMILVMGISLFTSRIILEKLGITDYGVYSAVGGVVAMLGFLNATLSAGTSRFITFELGKGNSQRLKETFNTAFLTHLFLGLIVAIILIIGGSWFVLNKLIIPAELRTPALWTFYISIITTFVSITQVPYTSVIIAHEEMNIYAYLGIFETCAKLGVAYAISLSPINKLVWYALLIASVQLISAMCYRIFCIKNFPESRLSRNFNKSIFKEILGFSGWSLMAKISQILSTQGLVVLINMFFAPALAAAQAIGSQISGALTQFSNNVLMAINPQVIKLYANGEKEASRKLTLQSTVLVWDLLLLLGLPLIVCMNPIIHIWLTDVPPYAVVFAQYIVACEIINVFSNTFYTPLMASGELKENSLAALWFGIGIFIVLYFLLRAGFDIMWVQYMSVIYSIVFACLVKPYILCKKLEFNIGEITRCYRQCLKTALFPIVFCVFISHSIDLNQSFFKVLLVGLIIIIIVIASSFLCMEKDIRQRIIYIIRNKLNS